MSTVSKVIARTDRQTRRHYKNKCIASSCASPPKGDRGGSGKSRFEPGIVLGTRMRSMQQQMRQISWAASLCLPLVIMKVGKSQNVKKLNIHTTKPGTTKKVKMETTKTGREDHRSEARCMEVLEKRRNRWRPRSKWWMPVKKKRRKKLGRKGNVLMKKETKGKSLRNLKEERRQTITAVKKPSPVLVKGKKLIQSCPLLHTRTSNS